MSASLSAGLRSGVGRLAAEVASLRAARASLERRVSALEGAERALLEQDGRVEALQVAVRRLHARLQVSEARVAEAEAEAEAAVVRARLGAGAGSEQERGLAGPEGGAGPEEGAEEGAEEGGGVFGREELELAALLGVRGLRLRLRGRRGADEDADEDAGGWRWRGRAAGPRKRASRESRGREELLSGAVDLLSGAVRRREEAEGAGARGVGFLCLGELGCRCCQAEGAWERFLRGLRRWNPLAQDVREVESRFGASTASFFEFFAWVTVAFGVVGGVGVLWSLRHLLVAGRFSWAQVEGLLVPRFLLQSSYPPQEAPDFAGLVLLSGLALAALGARRWVQEDLEEKLLAQQEGRGIGGEAFRGGVVQPFAKLLLNPWDFAARDATAARQLRLVNGELVLLNIHEADLDEIMGRRSPQQWAWIYASRALGFVGSVALLAVSAWAIVQLSVTSGDVEEAVRSSTQLAFLRPVANSIVPAAVAMLNSVTPVVLTFLTHVVERWDSAADETGWLVWRLFTARLTSVLVLWLTFAALADPYLLRGRTLPFLASDPAFLQNLRASLARRFLPEAYRCRVDQAGAGLLTILAIEFIASKAVLLSYPLGALAWSLLTRTPYRKPEIDIANRMAALIYTLLVGIMCSSYVPLAPAITALVLLANFKAERFAVETWMQKPLRPWRGGAAIIIVFLRLFLISVGVGLAFNAGLFVNRTVPAKCDVMRPVLRSLYPDRRFADPFCEAIELTRPAYLSALLPSATTASVLDRRSAFVLAGGELEHWLAAVCPTQCQDASNLPADASGDAASFCADRCANVDAIFVSCSRQAQATFTAGQNLGPIRKFVREARKQFPNTTREDASEAALLSTTFFAAANVTRPCDLACGPFVHHENAQSAVHAFFTATGGWLGWLWIDVLQSPAVLWTALFLVAALLFFHRNTLQVLLETGAAKYDAVKNTLHAERRKADVLARRLRLLREGTHNAQETSRKATKAS